MWRAAARARGRVGCCRVISRVADSTNSSDSHVVLIKRCVGCQQFGAVQVADTACAGLCRVCRSVCCTPAAQPWLQGACAGRSRQARGAGAHTQAGGRRCAQQATHRQLVLASMGVVDLCWQEAVCDGDDETAAGRAHGDVWAGQQLCTVCCVRHACTALQQHHSAWPHTSMLRS